MDLKNERKGEVIIFFELLIWAFFPVIAVLSYAKLPSVVSLLWATIFSGVFFISIVAYKKTWREFKNPLLWIYSAYATFFIGIMFYGLYFVGLTKTTPGNASIIALFEVFTSFLFFNILKKEKIS
jgi:drug/metabolite transporter (DMT)-like permease